LIFATLSFAIGNWLLSYIIGIEKLLEILVDDPRRHLIGLFFMCLFSAIFYLIFARFREQACTFICPYGRFQAAMVDENTMVVAYDHKRGEKRAPLHRNQSFTNRIAEGFGDCVNCRQCVAVCPTGIDIRNGTQMECVNCTACLDACDAVMGRIDRPQGLIRYASLNSIENGAPFRFTVRLGWYAVVLVALAGLLAILIFTRSEVETMILRAPGALFQQTAEGKISNLYTVKVLNKGSHDLPIQLRLENAAGVIKMMGTEKLHATHENLAQTSALVELEPKSLDGPKKKLEIGVYANGKRLETVKTVFIGPRS
jgi:cytochrome c oxidase accessory protein FixG